MKTLILQKAAIEVRKSPIHGFGVFAQKSIKKGDFIEECHIIIHEYPKNDLKDYVYGWDGKLFALPLGFGAIYNHSEKPNAKVTLDKEEKLMRIHAVRDIQPNEEIFTYYGENWFPSRGLTCQIKPLSLKERFLKYCKKTHPFTLIFQLAIIMLAGFLVWKLMR